MYLLAETPYGFAGFQQLGGIMRFTHPVNTLKKLGCGLAFGAAAIMAMPTSALACTQIYMGSQLTADGNTYYGRSEDFGPRYIKHFGIEPAHKDGSKYTSVESGFEYKSKGATYRYTSFATTPLSGKIVTTHIPRLASTKRAFPALPR